MNVLIVDDEYLIRDGLAQKINWVSFGFSHVDTAEHGLEALERMESTIPDLILMDIRMPFMDGLELIKVVKDKNPDICVIIISGHEEFSYAKTALQFNAFDYILKPINLNELETIIIKAVDYIRTSRQALREINDIRKNLKHSMPILKERFLINLIYRKLKPNDISSRASQFRLVEDAFYATAIIRIPAAKNACKMADSFNENQKRLEIFFLETLNSRSDIFVSTVSSTEYLLIVSQKQEDFVKDLLRDTVEEIYKIGKTINLPIIIFTGPAIKNLENLYLSHKGAAMNSNRAFISGDKHIYFFEDIPKNLTSEVDEVYDISKFREALTYSNRDSSLAELEDLRKKIRTTIPSSKLTLQILCSNIFYECKQAVQKLGAEINDVLGNQDDNLHTIIQQPTFEDMFDQLTDIVSRVLDYYDEIRRNQYSFDIEKAKKVIKDNINNEDLNLKLVADHIHVSPCHFSVIFKKKTGETFIHYLTNLRMEKARELLLNTDKKVYEVSYDVGYENPTYFSTLFKKSTGLSPFEYRRHVLSSTTGE